MTVCTATIEGRRDAAATFSLKLLALIDECFSRLVDTLPGTGRRSLSQFGSKNLMSQSNEDGTLTIQVPDGWVFAFEGGAHILFRHTTGDRRFVSSHSSQPAVAVLIIGG